jgi:LysM repeat protein
MTPLARLALVASGAGIMASTSLAASDQAQEYVQARKIALKDPKVQEAFERANERLDDRILEIEPSLKPYVEKHKAPAVSAKPAPAPVKTQPAVAKKSSGANDTTHVVVKGDTLSSIALQYKVSVSSLKSANDIADDRKLRVGQKLVIPPSSPKNTGEKPAKKEPSLWDRVQNSF